MLILIDEVMDYLRVAATDEALLAKDMAFLRGLLDSANEAKNCVVVMVMIASENDTMQLTDGGPAGSGRAERLCSSGTASTAAVTGGGDFADIIRRRLFAESPDPAVVSETADDFLGVDERRSGGQMCSRSSSGRSPKTSRQAVARCYPFHPSLIDLAEHEWSAHTGFQRVRSTIQIFATTVYAQIKRAQGRRVGPGAHRPGRPAHCRILTSSTQSSPPASSRTIGSCRPTAR